MAEMVACTLNGQFNIILPKHRADRPEWYTDKGWEKKRMESMHKTIGKGDMVYYVGSEEGEFPAFCSMWGADVLMFEPNPKVWSNTKAIWIANDLPTPLTFHGFASDVTDRKGEPIRASFPECADQEIEAAHGFKDLQKEGKDYPQVKIDDVWESGLFEPPTVISLDVEGAEGRVLRGAEQTLVKYHPKIYLSLHSEFMITQYNEWSAELRKWLTDLGYKEELLEYALHETHLLYT